MGLYHVRQHLHHLASILDLMLGGQRDDWLAGRLDSPRGCRDIEGFLAPWLQ